jgi:hypothetical protein
MRDSWPEWQSDAMAVLMVAALTHAANVAAQTLPPGGYYAGGVYYVPSEPPASAPAQAATPGPSPCLLGYGVPTVYVARTATAVRLYWFWPAGGESAPGFPYVPVYAPQAEC